MKAATVCAALFLTVPLTAGAAPPDQKIDPGSLIDHPGPGGAVDLSGAWQVKGSIEGGGGQAYATPVCDFQQQAAVIQGACKGPNSQGAVSGVIAGRHVSWRWQAVAYTQVGVTSTAFFEGDVGQDGVIRGTWRLDQLPGLSGAFTQQRR